MILNPNYYKESLDKQRPTILRGIEEGGRLDTLTLLSLGSHIPYAAVIAYALRPDVGGENPVLRKSYDSTVDFFKYDSVVPWDDL